MNNSDRPPLGLCQASLVLANTFLLLVACQDSDDPAGSQLVTGPVAAVAAPTVEAPSKVTAVGTTETRIDVAWQDNSSRETSFEVHRSTTGGSGSFTLLATMAANSAAYPDQGLYLGNQYCYKVRAVRVSGIKPSYSPFSNTTCATPALPAPSNPGAGAASENRIDLGWQDHSSYEAGFEIHRSTTGVNGTFGLYASVAANAVAYSDRVLVSGHQYCYRVRAFIGSGSNAIYSAFSSVACATTPFPSGPPVAPSGTVATAAGSSAVTVTWIDNSLNEDGFRVFRSTDGGLVWVLAATTVDPFVTDEGRQSDQPICYRVVAFNEAGSAPPSNTGCATPPAGPTNLGLRWIDANGTAEFTWQDNSVVEDGYEVWVWWHWACFYSACDSGYSGDYEGWDLIAALPPNSTSYRGQVSASGGYRSYNYYVVARKGPGSSDASNIVSTDP